MFKQHIKVRKERTHKCEVPPSRVLPVLGLGLQVGVLERTGSWVSGTKREGRPRALRVQRGRARGGRRAAVCFFQRRSGIWAGRRDQAAAARGWTFGRKAP